MFVYDSRWIGAHGIGRFASEMRPAFPNFADFQSSHRPSSPFDPAMLSIMLRRIGARFFLSPGFNGPLYPPCKNVLTIHDLIPVFCKEAFSSIRCCYFYSVQVPLIRKNPITITVSNFSKETILRACRVPESKVVVIGNGVSTAFTPSGPVERNNRPFFLFVGNNRPHKNVSTLLQAVSKLSKRNDFELKMVCPDKHLISPLIERLELERNVSFVSGATDEKLAELYRGSIATVVPSYYEGFGLPALEAMACGSPVVFSSQTSLPEIVQDAGIPFDPYSSSELADVLRRILDGTIQLAAFKSNGIQRAKNFSWEKSREILKTAIHSIL